MKLKQLALKLRMNRSAAALVVVALFFALPSIAQNKKSPVKQNTAVQAQTSTSTSTPSSQPQGPSAQSRFGACLTCHGEGGISKLPLTPSLAGQHSFYAITQLFLFREGRRGNEAMTAVTKGMSDADMQAFADLIAKLPPAPTPIAADNLDLERLKRGARLAVQHGCAACHGADFSGDKQVARLAHQREDYLAQTLTEFRSGKRLGYTQAMNEALAGISPEALKDLAYYLANFTKPN